MKGESYLSFSSVKEIVRGRYIYSDPSAADFGRNVERDRKKQFIEETAPESLQRLRLPQVSKNKLKFQSSMQGVDRIITCTPDIVTTDEDNKLIRWIEIKSRGNRRPDDSAQASFGIYCGTAYCLEQSGDLYSGEWKFDYYIYYDASQDVWQADREFWAENSSPFVKMCFAASKYLHNMQDSDLIDLKCNYLALTGE